MIGERHAELVIAAMMSVLLPGSGHIYNRETGPGLVLMVLCGLAWLVDVGGLGVAVFAAIDAVAVRQDMHGRAT